MQEEIIVISDIHYAKEWDQIGSTLPENAFFLNPNSIFKEIINSINQTQTLVINGDHINCIYTYCNGSKINNLKNWHSYLKILDKCQGEVHATLGNHDFRLSPYNFSIVGLDHLNLSKEEFTIYKNQSNKQKFRWHKEIQCIQREYPTDYPFKEFKSITKKNTQLIFLNTGPDNYLSLLKYLHPKNWNSLTKTPILIMAPITKGISEKQLDFLENNLKRSNSKEIYIFIHAPPFFSPNKIPTTKLYKNSKKALDGIGLDYGCFSNRRNEFIDKLIDSSKNIIVITSHTHIPNQYLLDKQNKTILQSNIKEINQKRMNSRYVKFISTLPIGSIEPHNKKIGKLIIGENIQYKVIKDFS